jgi:two-component system phosphate regulon sensor histidine kinase PhoR
VANKFLDIIDIEAERLFLLINDILTLSEIETMRQEVDFTNVSIENVVSDSLNILQGQADKKSISIETDIEPGLNLQANKSRIMQLVLNLVDNAIKYSPDGSRIIVKAFRKGEDIVISFKDFGIGIPTEHLTSIFERFYRVDKGRSRSQGGTGLGLSIVNHIVNLYNGNIKVFSQPGKGTEFIITLPC